MPTDDALPSVTAPETVAAAPELITAPKRLAMPTPVSPAPLIVSGSAVEKPARSSVAGLLTVVAPAVVPRPPALPSRRTPRETVIGPVRPVLLAASVSVLLPILVKPVPPANGLEAASLIAPESVMSP